jgi:hypothetical protein
VVSLFTFDEHSLVEQGVQAFVNTVAHALQHDFPAKPDGSPDQLDELLALKVQYQERII